MLMACRSWLIFIQLAFTDKENNVRYGKSSLLRNSVINLLLLFQERSAKADTTSTKVALRLVAPPGGGCVVVLEPIPDVLVLLLVTGVGVGAAVVELPAALTQLIAIRHKTKTTKTLVDILLFLLFLLRLSTMCCSSHRRCRMILFS